MHCHMISNQATSKQIIKQSAAREAGCVDEQCIAHDQIISMNFSSERLRRFLARRCSDSSFRWCNSSCNIANSSIASACFLHATHNKAWKVSEQTTILNKCNKNAAHEEMNFLWRPAVLFFVVVTTSMTL